jgi:hypothetical protein
VLQLENGATAEKINKVCLTPASHFDVWGISNAEIGTMTVADLRD